MLRLQELDIVESKDQLALIPEGKMLINTIYAYSYVVAQRDDLFAQALVNCDYLMPDGAKTHVATLFDRQPAVSVEYNERKI